MTQYYEFFCPVKIMAGHSALENIPFELHRLGASRPLIITFQSAKKYGTLALLENIFSSTEMQITGVFDQVPADSSLEIVQQIAQYYRKHQCDSILALGGGSVIDTAKAVNILVSEGGDNLLKYAGSHHLSRPLKPLFVIPTTSGTGSEVTMVSVIADLQRQQKIAIASYYLMPDVAILDSRVTQSLSVEMTAQTAMDALTHAIEAYIGMAHNPLSDAYAYMAIEKISRSLVANLQDLQNTDLRLELAQASTMAGIAFSNSMVGLVHALGHALGAVTHLSHGICMNLFLPYVLNYNLEMNRERIGNLLLPLAGAEIYAKTPHEHRAEKSIMMINELREQLKQIAQLPRTLQETGRVTQSQFNEIADKALNDGSIMFNHREVTKADLIQLLQQAWS